ncbi:hypothetical protein BCR37DRAFT_386239 [Protomyces lactucae-debilis]|uniref:Uncharacterized protein n=1 Tax=Protomyces lactucae-debilis TaxID=2754530 RepID=A0A1Y2FMR4_PROLT|nr:uncharacterized protein BCR37DRAFT_386239 [Protomyces lactucae-debilis]ORY84877.1 hypothetical protein BCR37DRAFT_386239 [Protomyces lactucae-debilis]
MQLLQLVSLLSSTDAAPANAPQKRQLGFGLDASLNAGFGLGYGYGAGGYGLANNFYQPYAYYPAFYPGYQLGYLRNAVQPGKPVSEEEAKCNAFLIFVATKPVIKAKMVQEYGSIMSGEVSLADEIKAWHVMTATDANATTTHVPDNQGVVSSVQADTVASPVVSAGDAKDKPSKKQPPTCLDLTEYIILYGDSELAANLQSAYGEWVAKMQVSKTGAVGPTSSDLPPSPGISTTQTASEQPPAVPTPAMPDLTAPVSAPAALPSSVSEN